MFPVRGGERLNSDAAMALGVADDELQPEATAAGVL
jgi:hypothetical protein